MPHRESMLCPFDMMRPFVSFQRILQNVAGAGKDEARVCDLAGGYDKLVDAKKSEKLATLFRNALEGLKETSRVDLYEDAAGDVGEGIITMSCTSQSHAIRLVILEQAPYHFQTDFHWDIGAKQFLAFADELQ